MGVVESVPQVVEREPKLLSCLSNLASSTTNFMTPRNILSGSRRLSQLNEKAP